MLPAKRLLTFRSKEPKAFTAEMRSCLMAQLATATDTGHLLVRYVTRLPLEKQRYPGYGMWTMAQLNRELEAGRVEAGQLLTIRMVASIEQAILDGHWWTAWPLTGLAGPPWATWERSSLSAHRLAFASSSLLSEAPRPPGGRGTSSSSGSRGTTRRMAERRRRRAMRPARRP